MRFDLYDNKYTHAVSKDARREKKAQEEAYEARSRPYKPTEDEIRRSKVEAESAQAHRRSWTDK